MDETQLQILTDEIQKNTVPLQNRINEIASNVKTLQDTVTGLQSSPGTIFGFSAGDVATLACILAAVEFLALIMAFVAISAIRTKALQLSTDLHNQKKLVQDMSNRITTLVNEIGTLKSEGENQRRSFEQKFLDMQPPVNKFPQQPPMQAPFNVSTYNAPPAPPPEKFKDFVDEFNKLARQMSASRSLESKNFVNEFARRYEIKEFSCINFEARMNEPVPPPQFGAVRNADFWAYEYEPGIYAVVPSINVKNYRDNYHNERAMGEVFSSNFESGRTYNKIFVESPAIFKGMWNLAKKGSLELS